LISGVRDCLDAAARIALGDPKTQRAPATPELQDLHSVLDAGALGGELQHGLLGVVESGDAVGPITTTVFEMPPQYPLEESCRKLVVLVVGGIDFEGDGTATQLADQALEAKPIGVRIRS
jgi:hypothetical protein